MSNLNDLDDDVTQEDVSEVDTDNTDDATDEQSSQADSEEVAEKQIKVNKAYEGMVNKEFIRVIRGEKSIDDVNDNLREDVESLVKKIPAEKQTETPGTIQQLKQELKVDSVLEQIEEDQQGEAKLEYNAFLQAGYDPEKALGKIRKNYGVLSEYETMSYGQRAHKPTASGGSVKSEVVLSAQEKAFFEKAGVPLDKAKERLAKSIS